MDYKKTNAPLNTVTRDMIELSEDTGNVYETVCIIAKRANQIAGEMKHDLEKKLQEFASLNDNLEETPATTRSCPSPHSSPHRNTWTTSSSSATPSRSATARTNPGPPHSLRIAAAARHHPPTAQPLLHFSAAFFKIICIFNHYVITLQCRAEARVFLVYENVLLFALS